MAREEKRAEALADRVAQMLGRRRRERALRSGCQAWRQAAVGKRRYRDALQGSALWHHRRGLTWSMTRWRNVLTPSIATDAEEISSVADRNTGGSPPQPCAVAAAAAHPTVTAARSSERYQSGRRSSVTVHKAGKVGGEEATKVSPRWHLRTRLSETEARLVEVIAAQRKRRVASIVLCAWRRQAAARRARTAALSRVLRNLFWRRPLSSALATWRILAALPLDTGENEQNRVLLEKARQATLCRLLRNRQRCCLRVRFGRWRARTRAGAVAADREAALRNAERAKKKRAAAAAAAAAAVKNATRTQGEEVKRATSTAAELQRKVEVLQEEVAASAAREQGMQARLHENRERAAALALATAISFRAGRDRLKTAHAVTLLRNAVCTRRRADAAAARISAVRRSRYLLAWNARALRAKHHRAALESATAFRAETSARALADVARAALREWTASATRRRRLRQGPDELGGKLRESRLRGAVAAWAEFCRTRGALDAAEHGREIHLARSRARRALGVWCRAAFGEGGGQARWNAGQGGRVLARLLRVGSRFNDASCRRRARLALRRWRGGAMSRVRLDAAEMHFRQATDRGRRATALRRWWTATNVQRCLRRSLENGSTFAALHGLNRGISLWRERVQQAARRKEALLQSTAATVELTAAATTSNTALSQGGDTRKAVDSFGLCVAGESHQGPGNLPASDRPMQQVSFRPSNPLCHPSSRQNGEVIPPSENQANLAEHSDDGAQTGNDTTNSSSTPDLLNLLVETCAAPPSYTLGSGLATLGGEVCSSAMHMFGLLSATLFEVTGGPHGGVERVAAARHDDGDGRLPTAAVAQDGSTAEPLVGAAVAAAAAPTAAMEWDVTQRELIGEGTVGIAAQSARPVCVEMVTPLEAGNGMSSSDDRAASLLAQQEGHGVRTRSAVSRVAGAAISTVLCVPIMLQTAPTALGGGGQGSRTSTSVEVVGVLRAVRVGSRAFAGDDARALSAFCGQLALVMSAERTLAEVRAGAAASAAKEARLLRRQACRKVLRLFAEGAVADSFLRDKHQAAAVGHGQERASSTCGVERDACSVSDLMLWRSVAKVAAETLRCESVDLLHVASLVPRAVGGSPSSGGGAARVADLLGRQYASSRSFRRRSSCSSLVGPPVSSDDGAPNSKDSGGGSQRTGEKEMVTWLCAPVLGARAESGGRGETAAATAVTGAKGAETARRFRGASLVCCAVNKDGGRSFDDVDEVLLGTIAALYGVALSWIKAPSPHTHRVNAGAANRRYSRDAGASTEPLHSLASHGCVQGLGAVNKRAVSTQTVNSSRRTEEIPGEANGFAGYPPTGHASQNRSDLSMLGVVVPSQATFRGASVGFVPRNSAAPRILHQQRNAANVAPAAPPVTAAAAAHEFRADGWMDTTNALPQRSVVAGPPRVQHRGRDEENELERHRAALDGADKVDVADVKEVEGNAKLRKRADRAERMLEATRERLNRALEDGVSNAAAGATAATAASASVPAVAADSVSGGSAEGKGDACANRHDEEERSSVFIGRRRPPLSGESESSNGTTDRSRQHYHRRSTSTRRRKNRNKKDETIPFLQTGGRQPYSDTDSSSHAVSALSLGGYYSSDGVDRRGRDLRSTRPLGLSSRGERGDDFDARQPRTASAAPGNRRTRSQRYSDEDDRAGADERGAGSSDRRRRRGRTELRASDLARMREVVAQLRIATAQLEAERCRRPASAPEQYRVVRERSGYRERGHGQEWERHLPPLAGASKERCRTISPPRGLHDGGRGSALPTESSAAGTDGVCGGRAAAEAEAAALIRENASLRKKLNGLVALEKLEGRAVRRGLLPLSGGGGVVPEGDFFSSHSLLP